MVDQPADKKAEIILKPKVVKPYEEKRAEVILKPGSQVSEPRMGELRQVTEGEEMSPSAKKSVPADSYTLRKFEASQIKKMDNFVDTRINVTEKYKAGLAKKRASLESPVIPQAKTSSRMSSRFMMERTSPVI